MNKRFVFFLVISIFLHLTIGFCAIKLFYRSSEKPGTIRKDASPQPSVSSTQQSELVPPPDSSKNERVFASHTVKRGESLWVIARDYKVSIEELMDANGLSSHYVLKVGDQLKIPKN